MSGKIDYRTAILEKLDDGPANLGALKIACHQRKNVNNIRKILNSLLKNGIIELNGYDSTTDYFKCDNIKFQKTAPEVINPIKVYNLLKTPMEGKNYIKIREIFTNRMKKINRIYKSESEVLEKLIKKIPLKDALGDRTTSSSDGGLQFDDICFGERVEKQENNYSYL